MSGHLVVRFGPAAAVGAVVLLVGWPRSALSMARALPAEARPRRWVAVVARRPRWVVGCLGLVVFATAAGPMVLLPAGAVPALRWWRRRRAERVRRRALDLALPPSIDLCTVVLGAGGTIRDCLDALALDGPDAVRPLADAAVARADGGHRLDQALRWFQHELGPGFQPLTGALLLAREQGGSVAVLLARLSVEANAGRRRLGELRARRLPVVLLVPLVACSLPAVVIGTVVPLALVALRDLDL